MFSCDTATIVGRINQITERRTLWLRQELDVPSGVRPLPDGKLCWLQEKKKNLSGFSRVPATAWGSGAELKALVMEKTWEKFRHKRRNWAPVCLQGRAWGTGIEEFRHHWLVLQSFTEGLQCAKITCQVSARANSRISVSCVLISVFVNANVLNQMWPGFQET